MNANPVPAKKMLLAKLKDFQGPFFPEPGDSLQKEFDGSDGFDCSYGMLWQFASKIDGFVKLERPTTSDGYFWGPSIFIKTKDGMLVIALPKREDIGFRHIAFYMERSYGDGREVADKVIKSVYDGYLQLKDEYRRRYASMRRASVG